MWYDAVGRRIQKSVTAGGSLDGVTQYFYDGRNAIEERNAADVVTTHYVFRPGSNEALTVTNVIGGGGPVSGGGEGEAPSGTRSFFHQNVLGSVFAITDDVASIVEGYIHDVYGIVGVYNPGLNGVVDFHQYLDLFTRIGGS